MATFHYNRFSGESVNSQWSRYLQNQSYISDIGEIVSQNRKDLQATLNAASAEQKKSVYGVRSCFLHFKRLLVLYFGDVANLVNLRMTLDNHFHTVVPGTKIFRLPFCSL